MKTTIEARRNQLWQGLKRLVPRQPIWRAVTALLVVIAVAGGVLWGLGIFKQTPPPIMIGTPVPVVVINAVPTQTAYLPGEAVTVEFSFKNIWREPVTILPFPPEIEVTNRWTPEIIRSFPAGSGELTLPPGETVTYTLVWDQKDANGQQVAPGYYDVDLKSTYIKDAEDMTGAVRNRTKILIQFPQGAMEKTIEVNRSQWANGVTITLERVELSALGAKVYILYTPPGYTKPQIIGSPPSVPPPQIDYAWGVDGNLVKESGYIGYGFGEYEDGIRLIWDDLDPVPSDARVLTLTITRIGEWTGHWEFQIPLE